MILQALNNYYDRLKDDADKDIPLFGFANRKIHFALLIDQEGRLVQVRDLRESKNNKTFPKQMIVPKKLEERSGNKIDPCFMWDNTMYVFGMDSKGKDERSLLAFEAFKEFHHKLGDNLDDEGMKAMLSFLDSWNHEDAFSLKYWDEMAGRNIVFQLDGDTQQFLHERPKIKETWLRHIREESSDYLATCLVSGEGTSIARIHPAIKGVRGAQTKGAAIISFNLKAFKSYGKSQSFNAPVSKEITFSYTTALNYLLSSESRQKVQIGDATTGFWTERASPIEGFMGAILNPRDDQGDLKDVRDFLEAMRDGKKTPELNDPDIKFYILGLAPNASRLSVRFWHISTVEDISLKISRHFHDLSIVKQYDNNPSYPGMWQLLRETAVRRDSRNISPLLAGAVMRSIITGTPYPRSLLASVITRIRADQLINYLRSAIIKAYLIRSYRFNNNISKEVSMSLNTEATNIAYRLGRLFAVLEKAQRDAIPGANTTIKDRFYGTASSTPRVAFPLLLRLAQHHVQKAKYGHVIDKTIEEIISGIQIFPAHLSLEEQGLFALGYYHQRQAFFSKSLKQEGSDEL